MEWFLRPGNSKGKRNSAADGRTAVSREDSQRSFGSRETDRREINLLEASLCFIMWNTSRCLERGSEEENLHLNKLLWLSYCASEMHLALLPTRGYKFITARKLCTVLGKCLHLKTGLYLLEQVQVHRKIEKPVRRAPIRSQHGLPNTDVPYNS